jgi:mRNA interferase YafQ
MYRIVWSNQFKKQYQKILKSNLFKQAEFRVVINCLVKDEKLDRKYRDHQLKGELQNYRECHIQSDILLVYQKSTNELIVVLVKIGSHSELFK